MKKSHWYFHGSADFSFVFMPRRSRRKHSRHFGLCVPRVASSASLLACGLASLDVDCSWSSIDCWRLNW